MGSEVLASITLQIVFPSPSSSNSKPLLSSRSPIHLELSASSFPNQGLPTSIYCRNQSHLPMFDFEKLEVYRQAKSFHLKMKGLTQMNDLQNPERNQLIRASLSIVLNIAEGAGRFSERDKRNFYIIARGSVYECIAILDLMKDQQQIEGDCFRNFFTMGEEISRMLYSLIKRYS